MRIKKDEVEEKIKKSAQDLRELMAKAKDPEKSNSYKFYNPKNYKKDQTYRFRISMKYWENDLSELTSNERLVFLHYRIHANWQTGIAFLGSRKASKILKMKKDTFLKATNSLVKKKYLKKEGRCIRVYKYKILKN